MLKPVDVVVLLKMSLFGGPRPAYLRLANELFLYPSEVYASVKRSRESSLLQGPERKDRVNKSALLEFLLHGVRYAFPAQLGAMTRGIPTAFAAAPLSRHIQKGKDPVPVWSFSEGTVRGYEFAPLHKNVPRAALQDKQLYESLALVDALRGGKARERQLARMELRKRLGEDV